MNDPSRIVVPTIFGPKVLTVDELSEKVTIGLMTGELTPAQAQEMLVDAVKFNAAMRQALDEEFGTDSSQGGSATDSSGGSADENSGDSDEADDAFAEFVQGLLDKDGGEESEDRASDDLRDNEGDTGGDFDQYAQSSDSDSSPLDHFVNNSSAYQDRDLDYGNMESQQEIKESTTTGDDDVRQSDLVRNQGGYDAQDINRETTGDVAQGDRKNSWGNMIGDSIADGVEAGATAAANTIGAAAADHASSTIFHPASGSKDDAGSGGGESAAGAEVASSGMGGGGGGGHTHAHPGGGDGSRSAGSAPVKPPPVSAPHCPNCGATMVKCGDGQYHCPNSAYVRDHGTGKPGVKPAGGAGETITYGPVLTVTGSGGKPASMGTRKPAFGGKPPPASTPSGTWQMNSTRGGGQVQPTGMHFVPAK